MLSLSLVAISHPLFVVVAARQTSLVVLAIGGNMSVSIDCESLHHRRVVVSFASLSFSSTSQKIDSFERGSQNRHRRFSGTFQTRTAFNHDVIDALYVCYIGILYLTNSIMARRRHGTRKKSQKTEETVSTEASNISLQRKKLNFESFQVSGNTNDRNGPHKKPRGDVHDLYTSSSNPETFKGLQTKRRSLRRYAKLLVNAKRIVVPEGVDTKKKPKKMKKKKNEPLVYYCDDNVAGFSKDNLPEINGPHTLKMASELEEYDDMDDKYGGKDLVFVTKTNRIVAIKLSRKHRSRIRLSEWEKLSNTLSAALKIGRNNPRGDARGGVFSKYVNFGLRKDPKGVHVDEYATKKTFVRDEENSATETEEVKRTKEDVAVLFDRLLKAAGLFVPPAVLSAMAKLKEDSNLGEALVNGDRGMFTALALAMEYWSPLHKDKDVFYTILSCHCPSMVSENGFDEDILFRFLFPTMNMSIPMRNTDILLFDSSFPHCSTNYLFRENRTFSLFTAEKTVYAHLAGEEECDPLLFSSSSEEEDDESMYDSADEISCYGDVADNAFTSVLDG
jgi:hypothetical protein